MTPLAHSIAKELTLPIKRREFRDKAGSLLHDFRQEIHTFEVTSVRALADSLAMEMSGAKLPSIEWTFLPAERTWIEWKEDGGRIGAMLQRKGSFAEITLAGENGFGSVRVGQIAMHDQLIRVASDGDAVLFRHYDDAEIPALVYAEIVWRLYAYLLIINSPRVVGRTLHNPNRGLQRRLSAAIGVQGKFPLRAWTEIVLKPEIADETASHDIVTGLTGQVCRHWVRSHKQRYDGVWTLVADYWRGDASLGIKQSRYKIVA